jgi:hypothetical protein
MAEWIRLTIVIAFDVGKQVTPSDIPLEIFTLMDEFGFQRAEEVLRRLVVSLRPMDLTEPTKIKSPDQIWSGLSQENSR